jgi:hypothetical protein
MTVIFYFLNALGLTQIIQTTITTIIIIALLFVVLRRS